MLGTFIDERIPLKLSTGADVTFSFREFFGFARTLPFFLAVSIGFVIVATGHPVTMPQFDDAPVRVAYWLFALCLYIPCIFLVSIPVRLVWDKITTKPLPHILFSVPLVCFITVVSAVLFIGVFEPGKRLGEVVLWQMMLRGIVIGHVVETIILAWLLPNYRKSFEQKRRCVTLAGQQFPLDEILRVQAAEHHLELYGPKGVTTIRERMSTFLEQVTPDEGVQPHRSHWVSRAAAVRLAAGNVVLPCGKSVPVARARGQHVAEWFDDYATDAVGDAQTSLETPHRH